jgi:hypothetical protein
MPFQEKKSEDFGEENSSSRNLIIFLKNTVAIVQIQFKIIKQMNSGKE